MEKNAEKWIVGAALAFAATTLLPIARQTLRPLAVSGIQGAMGLLDKAKSAAQVMKEEVEDIVAEAKFERMKKQMDREIALSDHEPAMNHDGKGLE
jgi:hypothetical protein